MWSLTCRFVIMIRRPPRATRCPYRTLCRSGRPRGISALGPAGRRAPAAGDGASAHLRDREASAVAVRAGAPDALQPARQPRSEEHTYELQSRHYLVCRLLLEIILWCRTLHA